MQRSLWIAIALVGACGKGSGGGDRPKLTQMPPGADGLVIGASTEAQIMAKLAGAEVSKDQSLGGSMVVQFDDHPAENVRTGKTTATLWKDASGTLRLMRLEMTGAGLCDWATKAIAAMNGPTACATNRRLDPGEVLACVASRDGALPLSIRCVRDTLDLGVRE